MRDFILLLAPVAVVIYFLIYPSQFAAFLAWMSSWMLALASARHSSGLLLWPRRGCPLWVISRRDAYGLRCPLYPRKRTLIGASIKRHQLTPCA
jgi:hypothetical protein